MTLLNPLNKASTNVMAGDIFPSLQAISDLTSSYTINSAPHANVHLCLCLRKHQGSMFSGTAIISWHRKAALRIKWLEKPREDERFPEAGTAEMTGQWDMQKLPPDTGQVCERWQRMQICPQSVCNDLSNVIVYLIILDYNVSRKSCCIFSNWHLT